MEALTAQAGLLIIQCPARPQDAGNLDIQYICHYSLNGQEEEVEENVA
jgi:hypothetical protein